jgi:hypothetical protein
MTGPAKSIYTSLSLHKLYLERRKQDNTMRSLPKDESERSIVVDDSAWINKPQQEDPINWSRNQCDVEKELEIYGAVKAELDEEKKARKFAEQELARLNEELLFRKMEIDFAQCVERASRSRHEKLNQRNIALQHENAKLTMRLERVVRMLEVEEDYSVHLEEKLSTLTKNEVKARDGALNRLSDGAMVVKYRYDVYPRPSTQSAESSIIPSFVRVARLNDHYADRTLNRQKSQQQQQKSGAQSS